MPAAIASGAAFGLCLAGMAALALAMERHGHLAGCRPEHLQSLRMALRIAGASLLAAGLWSCAADWGATVGGVVWFGWLTVAAWSTVALLSWRPRWMLLVAVLVALAGLAMRMLP